LRLDQDMSSSPSSANTNTEWRNNFHNLPKSELIEIISNLDSQLNEAEEKVESASNIQV